MMKQWLGAGKFLTSFAVLVLLSVAAGFGGMAELGRGGGSAGGGKKVKLTTSPPVSVITNPGESAFSVLTRLGNKLRGAQVIVLHGACPPAVPANADACIEVTRGQRSVDIEIENEDPGFQYGKTLGVGVGNHRVSFVLEPGGTTAGGQTVTVVVDDTHTATVNTTAGMSGSDVLDALKVELDAVLPGTYTVRRAGNKLQITGANKVDWESTDLGLLSFGVKSLGPPTDIPTLSGWGMAFLVLLLAGAGWILMRRRARPAGA